MTTFVPESAPALCLDRAVHHARRRLDEATERLEQTRARAAASAARGGRPAREALDNLQAQADGRATELRIVERLAASGPPP